MGTFQQVESLGLDTAHRAGARKERAQEDARVSKLAELGSDGRAFRKTMNKRQEELTVGGREKEERELHVYIMDSLLLRYFWDIQVDVFRRELSTWTESQVRLG